MDRFQIIRATVDDKDYATLEVSEAVDTDTGYYSCILDWEPRLVARQFIFVHGLINHLVDIYWTSGRLIDGFHFITDPNSVSLITADMEANHAENNDPVHLLYVAMMAETVMISCIPTHPDVDVKIFKDNDLTQKHYTPVIIYQPSAIIYSWKLFKKIYVDCTG